MRFEYNWKYKLYSVLMEIKIQFNPTCDSMSAEMYEQYRKTTENKREKNLDNSNKFQMQIIPNSFEYERKARKYMHND